MTIGTRLYTWWCGELVGSDAMGNRYYREKGNRALVKGGGLRSRERRWVLYAGEAEASKVTPDWHGWLHHSNDVPPSANSPPRRPWQKDAIPNRTGTALAYHPPGSVLAGGHRPRATGDYEPWTPN